MNPNIKPIPDGYTSVTPYLTVRNASKAIDFYEKAFCATEIGRISMPDGSVAHAEMQIGDARIMLADENEQWGNRSPEALGGSPISICLYVENVDEVFDRAVREGANVREGMEVKDQFHGDRTGTLTDPFGHQWTIMTNIEQLSWDELQKRSNALFAEVKQ